MGSKLLTKQEQNTDPAILQNMVMYKVVNEYKKSMIQTNKLDKW